VLSRTLRLPFNTADTVERDNPHRRAISLVVIGRLGLLEVLTFMAYPQFWRHQRFYYDISFDYLQQVYNKKIGIVQNHGYMLDHII
jgi:hypothetical protein